MDAQRLIAHLLMVPGRALQPLPLAPPRARRGGRLGLFAQRHARRRRGLNLHVVRLIGPHLDSARTLPPPARRAFLFRHAINRCVHFLYLLKLSGAFPPWHTKQKGSRPTASKSAGTVHTRSRHEHRRNIYSETYTEGSVPFAYATSCGRRRRRLRNVSRSWWRLRVSLPATLADVQLHKRLPGREQLVCDGDEILFV